MANIAFALPERPGKSAAAVAAFCSENIREYEKSRQKLGVTMERAYMMATPMGNMVVVYAESNGEMSAATMFDALAEGTAFEREFLSRLEDVHGVDPSAAPPRPERVGQWRDPEITARGHGMAFMAPLLPGKTGAGRAFAAQAYETRHPEMAASRRLFGLVQESVFLNQTPQGDIVCIYLEGDDPALSNRHFAESQAPFDLWFKAECRKIIAEEVDFSKPVPPVQTLWDWQAMPHVQPRPGSAGVGTRPHA